MVGGGYELISRQKVGVKRRRTLGVRGTYTEDPFLSIP